MILCKGNVTRVLQRVGFQKWNDSSERGFVLEHGATGFSVEWRPYFWAGTEETRDRERNTQLTTMMLPLSRYWQVTRVRDTLELAPRSSDSSAEERDMSVTHDNLDALSRIFHWIANVPVRGYEEKLQSLSFQQQRALAELTSAYERTDLVRFADVLEALEESP